MAAKKIVKYVIFDIIRSRLIITYTALLLLLTFGIIYVGRDVSKATVSLLNVVLLLVPLVSIIFGTIHIYNSRNFIEMLLSLPVKRANIFWAEYFGLSFSLSVGFIAGVGLPILLYGISITALYLLLLGIVLSFVFTGLAFLSSVINEDKAKGIGLSLMMWFYLSVIFDGLVFLIYMLFSDYPVDKFIMFLTALNPIDLARITILLRLDISALMGYTGATFQKFFGSIWGMVFSIVFLLLWIIIPATLALRKFNKKNF